MLLTKRFSSLSFTIKQPHSYCDDYVMSLMDSAQADFITDRQLSIVFTSGVDLELISVFVFFLTSPEIEIDSQLFLVIFNN